MVSLHDDLPPVKPWNAREWADLHGETAQPDSPEAELVVGDPLSRYTEAYLDLQEYRADHVEIFAAFASLERRVANAETELKIYAREVGDIANETVTVTVSYPMSHIWDGDKLVELVPDLKGIPGLLTIRTEIDTKKLEGLVKLGIVDGSAIRPALREEPMTPRVSIKIKLMPVEANNVA